MAISAIPNSRQSQSPALPENPHPLVADLGVSSDSAPADCRFAFVQNALLRGAEARGYTVGCPGNDVSYFWTKIGGERVDWRLRERCFIRNEPLTKKELKRQRDGKTTQGFWHLSGYLVLTVSASYSGNKHIYEKHKCLFDRRIEEFLALFEALAAHAAEQKQQSEDWERRRVEKLERWEAKQLRAAREEAWWGRLRCMAAEWSEAGQLKAFVKAIEKRFEKLDQRPEKADIWLDWAKRRIASLDPSRNDPRAVFMTGGQMPQRPRPRSDYEREFGEPDPDIEEVW
jgi:hypothetical protein